MTETTLGPEFSYAHGFLRIAVRVLRDHPLPWKIEADWTYEVRAADNAIVAKSSLEIARNIIYCAESLDAGIPLNNPHLLHDLEYVAFQVLMRHGPPWIYNPERGELFASDNTVIATGLTHDWAQTLCNWVQEKQDELNKLDGVKTT